MNNELRSFLDKNNISCKKITLKNGVSIISSDDCNYVIKKNKVNLKDTYRYLNSRSFDYYPKLLLESNDYNIFEYIDNIETSDDEKARDIMHIVGLLHAKTTYYKEIDIADYKEIYEEITNHIEYLHNYYIDIISVIDREVYMSPSHYLFARNINIIFNSINTSKILLDKWYDIIKEKKKIRLVTIHNNLSIDHYLRNDKPYLVSWDKSKIDMPIYDLLNFYRKYALSFDFNSLFHYYESIYPLLEEEKLLLSSLISIPDKIEFNEREYQMCKKLRRYIDYLYKSKELVNSYQPSSKTTTTKK